MLSLCPWQPCLVCPDQCDQVSAIISMPNQRSDIIISNSLLLAEHACCESSATIIPVLLNIVAQNDKMMYSYLTSIVLLMING